MRGHCDGKNMDYGKNPYVLSVRRYAMENPYFRTAVWTGTYMQMTLMSIPPCGEIGWEIHEDTDQLIRIESGKAFLQMGREKNPHKCGKELCREDAVFIPAGTWHNIINAGRCHLKVSSVYAPPHHPKGIVQETAKSEAY